MVSDFPDIVLVGGTGTGKSTAADCLSELGYRKLGFAGRAEQPHKGSPRDLVSRAWGPEFINDREKLIALANGARAVDPDVWLHSLERVLDARPEDLKSPVVVDDCRFKNEFYGLKARGFVTVRIVAGYNDRVDRLKTNGKWTSHEYLEHEIEHYLDLEPTDYTIDNEGTRDELFDTVVNVLRKERKRR